MRKQGEIDYWREAWKAARHFRVDLPRKQFCNGWHVHFDMEGRGDHSRFAHRRHLKLLMHAYGRARRELAGAATPVQLFAVVHERESGSDGLYVHTPNPYSAFPMVFDDGLPMARAPAILAGLVDLASHRIVRLGEAGDRRYIVMPTAALPCRV